MGTPIGSKQSVPTKQGSELLGDTHAMLCTPFRPEVPWESLRLPGMSPRQERAPWSTVEMLLEREGVALSAPERGHHVYPEHRITPESISRLISITQRLYTEAVHSPRRARVLTHALPGSIQRDLALLWAGAALESIQSSLGGWAVLFVHERLRCQNTVLASNRLATLRQRYQQELCYLCDDPTPYVRETVAPSTHRARSARLAEIAISIGERSILPEFSLASALEYWRRPATRRHGAPALTAQLRDAATIEVVTGGGMHPSDGYKMTIAGSATDALTGHPQHRISGVIRLDGPVGLVLTAYGVPLAQASLFPEDEHTLSIVQMQLATSNSRDLSRNRSLSEHQIPLIGSVYWRELLLDAALHFAALEEFQSVRIPDISWSSLARFAGRDTSPDVFTPLYRAADRHGAFRSIKQSDETSALFAPAQKYVGWRFYSTPGSPPVIGHSRIRFYSGDRF